jgi:general secretion pathway protein H
MPTSATGTSISRASLSAGGSAPASARGFSLLELLVVVTIIGIFAGAAVLSMGVVGSDRELEREALRLRSLVELLREEALLQGRDYGLLLGENRYRFYVYDHVQAMWVEPADDRLLRERELPEGLYFRARIEDRDLVLRRRFDDTVLEDPRPQVMILASGEITPFETIIARDGRPTRFTLTAELDGKLEVAEDEGL